MVLALRRSLGLVLVLGMGCSAFGATRTKRKKHAHVTAAVSRSADLARMTDLPRATETPRATSLAHASLRSRSARARKVLLSTREPASRTLPLHTVLPLRGRRHFVFNPWTEPTFADSTLGDRIDGEDLTVRRAAVQALGPYNGSVVVVDPNTGRILTIVNQNLAYKDGFQPCSTIKLVAALAGLNEGLVEQTTPLRVARRTTMDLTEALARSNNYYFAQLGIRLGFEKVTHYARLFGLGEKASLIPEEQEGTLPPAPPEEGGMGMMTSFGSGINLTPLQLAALVSAIANGGTLYYLQHPQSEIEMQNFVPRVKRQLNIAQWIPEIKPGMNGAVEYGTARRASYEQSETIYGKTGTCSDIRSPGVHLGWFGSFNETATNGVAVVVLLTGGKPISGPVAAGVAGAVYRNLGQAGYFSQKQAALSSTSGIAGQIFSFE